jgi:D-serine deaminase-like pyridoxal phosphate-dependent protein
MPLEEAAQAHWERYRHALGETPLPAALVDLDSLESNVDRVLALARGKPLRIATKSIRSPALIRRILDRTGGAACGLMAYAAAELAFLRAQGLATNFLLAYPTVQRSDVDLLAAANRDGAIASTIVDAVDQLQALDHAAERAGTIIPVVVEIDLAWRPRPAPAHVGVWRSPLRTVADVAAFVERIAGFSHLRFHGLMGYEAQVAGLADENPFARWQNAPRRLIKWRSRRQIERTRRRLSEMLHPALFNGGGTGSLKWSAAEPALTEVTVGSGFLDSHLFDGYRDLALTPAAYFALQVVRRPADGIVTCHGGGYVASGEAGPDRLPRPVLPEGLALILLEGAGEVQTPLRVPHGSTLSTGDPVFFRHAKAGELAEHFNEYLLVRGDRVEDRAPTYRGLGQAFLG